MIHRGDLPSVRERGRRLVLTRALTARGWRVRAREVSPFTRDHPIVSLVGAGHAGGQAPDARDKHSLMDR